MTPDRCPITGDTKPAWMTDAQFRIERIRTAVFSRLRSSPSTTNRLIRACSIVCIVPEVTAEEIVVACDSLNASVSVKSAADEMVWSVDARYMREPVASLSGSDEGRTPPPLEEVLTDAGLDAIAARQALVPACSFRHDNARKEDRPLPRSEWWAFAEVDRDSGNKPPIVIYAPAEIVDVTPAERFADAIVGACEDGPHLLAEVRRAHARITALEAGLTEALDGWEAQAAMPPGSRSAELRMLLDPTAPKETI